MPFPNRINYNNPIGFPGDFASANVYRSAFTIGTAYRAGQDGVTIGRFAWVQDDTEIVANKPPSSAPTAIPVGFVRRDQTQLITGYLDESTMVVNRGFAPTVMTGGDFFAITSTNCSPGDHVFASTTDGSVVTASSSTAPANSVATGWIVIKGATTGNIAVIAGPVAPMPVATSTTTQDA